MSGTVKRLLIVMLAGLALAVGVTASVVQASGKGVSGGGVPIGTPSGQASISTSNCKLPKADFVTNDTTGLTTTSTTYVAVPGMTKTVNLGGTGPSCVLVDVSGFAFAPGGALEFVSVQIDGVTGSPIETQFAGDTKGVFAEAHSALFGFPSVAAGSHSVAMVFRSLDGKSVFVHRPAMQISHK